MDNEDDHGINDPNDDQHLKPQSNDLRALKIMSTLIPAALLGGYLYWVMKQMGNGGPGNPMGMTKNKGPVKETPNVHWDDVAGYDDVKTELKEVVDFLTNRKKYIDRGARVPRGVLLYGPPGTGKTMLAKAVATEAGVSFFSMSGSQFVEMFVGVGAARVRELFAEATKARPAIIFIDELDAVGRQRGGAGPSNGGTDEKDQTLNEILRQMDGFNTEDNIVVIGATNRIDVLDSALTRPGRFDRHISVDNPDRETCRKILLVHAKGKPIDKSVDFDEIALGAIGLSGAGLAMAMNEAALLSARENTPTITQEQILEGLSRAGVGITTTRPLKPEERELTAWHEAGHAIAGLVLEPNTDPVQRISIVPRGQSLGHTLFVPEDTPVSQFKEQLLAEMVMCFAGRAAEEQLKGKGKYTSGLEGDLQRATQIATAMVSRWAMGDGLAPVYATATVPGGAPELDADMKKVRNELLSKAYEKATELLTTHKVALEATAKELMKGKDLYREDFLNVADAAEPGLVQPFHRASVPKTRSAGERGLAA